MEKTKSKIIDSSKEATIDIYQRLVNKALVIKTMVSIKDFLLVDSPELRVKVDEDGIHVSDVGYKDVATVCALVAASPENFELKLTADNYGTLVLYYIGNEEQELSIWQSLEFAINAFKLISTSIVPGSQGDQAKDDATRIVNELLHISYN